jgi:hypothetical protein
LVVGRTVAGSAIGREALDAAMVASGGSIKPDERGGAFFDREQLIPDPKSAAIGCATARPNFLRTTPARKARTVCACRHPRAADANFDDSARRKINSKGLGDRRRSGKMSFLWYRTGLTMDVN